jgi:hypothetical protein
VDFVGILALKLIFSRIIFADSVYKHRRKRSLTEVIQALNGKPSGDFL